MNESILVSIIVPVFNESEGLPALIAELSRLTTNQWGDRFEFVLVDDGSSDDTWQVLLTWADKEPRVTAVRLAGNRGAHRAGQAGMEVAEGDVMISVPADLQEGLDLVEACVERWHNSGRMAVMMVPNHGHAYDRTMDSIAARAFYGILRLSTSIHGDLSVRAAVKLMDRVAVDAFLEAGSISCLRTPFVLNHKLPYDVVHYEVRKRARGKSKWTFRKKVLLMMDMLVECSSWLLSPWRIAFAGGALYASVAILSAVSEALRPALSVLADICLGTTVLIVLSILGIYIARMHQELRGGPAYVIREVRRGTIGSARPNSEWRPDPTDRCTGGQVQYRSGT